MGSSSKCRPTRVAAFAALALALGLAGCGRKSGLDPPPAASIAQPAPGQKDAHAAAQGQRAAPPPAEKKSFFLDWLLN